MRVRNTFIGFTGEIYVGRLSFFIDIGADGAHVNNDELIAKAIQFPRLVLIGEPFEDRDDIPKFIRNIIKKSPNISIEINTFGNIRPVQLGAFYIQYIVTLRLKNTGAPFSDRIVPEVIKWYVQMNAHFKFYVNNEDDCDEVDMLIRDHGIKKAQVFLACKGEATSEKLSLLLGNARKRGYNFSLDFGSTFWPIQ